MQPVPQDLLKEYVQSQHFTSTTEIMEAMKEMFRDVIQTVMEVEMDEELGRSVASAQASRRNTPETTAMATRRRPSRPSWVRWTSKVPGTGMAPF